jgi:Calcineurin-like phosphoesterase
MKQYLFLGDTHGDMEFAVKAVELAADHGAEIIQLGDWSFLWPRADKLRELSWLLMEHEVIMRFIDGNHDDHPRLQALAPTPVATQIAPYVIYQPRGSVHEDEDGTRFLFLGGAPSIDKAFRTPGKSWWPEETITEFEFELAMSADGPIHVVVTHDAPAFPPGYGPKGDDVFVEQSRRSMAMIAEVLEQHEPEFHVHGHWHERYTRGVTHGLDCNHGRLSSATMLWQREAP